MSLFISYRGSINVEARVMIWLLDADVRRGILPSNCSTWTILAGSPTGQVRHVVPEMKPSQLASDGPYRKSCCVTPAEVAAVCESTRQQKPKGILAFLEKVISFYVMTLQSNCAENNCFYCLNTFLVLEHPGGFNCACNFADINEGD